MYYAGVESASNPLPYNTPQWLVNHSQLMPKCTSLIFPLHRLGPAKARSLVHMPVKSRLKDLVMAHNLQLEICFGRVADFPKEIH
jgi:hypothetical protein